MRLKPLLQDEDGGAMAEAMLTLPVFLAVVLGAVYYMLTLWQYNALHYAVDQGARCAILSAGTNSVGGSGRLCGTATTAFGANSFVAGATATTSASGAFRCLTVNYPVGLGNLNIAGIFVYNGNTTLNDKVCYPVQ